MNKINSTTMNIQEENVKTIKEMFPSCVSEDGRINFENLRILLDDEIDESREKYGLIWNGKAKAIKTAQQTSNKTLRPCKEISKDWDNTENIYIEGDNLEVLKQLQKTYFGAVDMIYIDPPYNTGNNLIYKNDFSISSDQYLVESGQADDLGNRYVSNPSSSGRFHSDWLSMMYSRLILARNLLSDKGIIAIAMDESEIGTLNIICKEIFGEQNMLGTIVTKCNPQGRGAKNVDPVHEYHIICAKDINSLDDLKLKRDDNEADYRSLMRSGTNSRKFERPFRYYPLLVKNGKIECIEDEEYNKIYAEKREFNELFLEELTNKYQNLGYEVIYPIAKNGEEKVWQRQFSRVKKECNSYIFENGTIKAPVVEGKTPFSLWADEKNNNVEYGTNLVKKLFDGHKVFDYCKSVYTVKDLISLNDDYNVILDFFSGSATTAHSVFQLNVENDSNKKFILVQLPEVCSEDSEAKKQGYDTICEIGEERIRRAGEQIKKDWEAKNRGEGLLENNVEFPYDIGFKVFRLDSTNIKQWDNTSVLNEDQISLYNEVFKEDRTKEDILYEIMLKYGVFDMKATETIINNKKMFRVGSRYMIVCFEDQITSEDIKAICDEKPRVAVFKEEGFANDNDKINAVYNLEKAGVEDVRCI